MLFWLAAGSLLVFLLFYLLAGVIFSLVMWTATPDLTRGEAYRIVLLWPDALECPRALKIGLGVILLLLVTLVACSAQIAPITGPVSAIVEEEAAAAGLDPVLMRRIAAIESGGDCSNRTGSYIGLFQLRNGSRDCRENARAAMATFKGLIADFREIYAREPSPTEIYLSHQQGQAGLNAHLTHPGRLAWISMASTGEGQELGENWAKAAIWGNVPSNLKPKFKNVDLITSSDFVNLWRVKVEGERAPLDTWAARQCRPLYQLRPLR